MALFDYTITCVPQDHGPLTVADVGCDVIARQAACIQIAYDLMTAGDTDFAQAVLRVELDSPLLSGGVFYG